MYSIEKTGYSVDKVMVTMKLDSDLAKEFVRVICYILDFSKILKNKTRDIEAEREAKRKAFDPILKSEILRKEKEIYEKFLEYYPKLKFRLALRKARQSLEQYHYFNLGIFEEIVRKSWKKDGNKIKTLYEK